MPRTYHAVFSPHRQMRGGSKVPGQSYGLQQDSSDETAYYQDTLSCSCSQSPDDIDHRGKIRVLALISVVIAATELVMAVPLHNFLNDQTLFGAWWSVLLILLAGFISSVGESRGSIAAGCVLAGIGTVVGLLGFLSDRLAAIETSGFDLCAQPTVEDSMCVCVCACTFISVSLCLCVSVSLLPSQPH